MQQHQSPVASQELAETVNGAAVGPVLLDLGLQKLVSGGAPKGGWDLPTALVVGPAPKGGW
jgi:hypothetical protein